MTEAVSVATALEVRLPVSPAQLIELTRPFGAHKTSMLQDFEAGREVELDTIVGSVIELARRHDIVTPALDAAMESAGRRLKV